MPHDIESITRFISDHSIEFLDLKTVDLVGKLHHVTLPVASGIMENIMNHGVGFDGSSYGFLKVEQSDMVLKPDLDTARIDPFRDRPTLSFFADIYLTDARRSRFDQDGRWIAARAENLLRQLDIADRSLWGPEFEFYLFSSVEYDTRTSASFYKVIHDEEFHSNAYHACSPFDLYDDFRDEACNLLKKSGIGVKYHHHEVGERGQQEIETCFAPLLQTADAIIMTKYLIFSLAVKKELEVTFMPKPMYNQAGSGMHVHQFLVRDDANCFFEEGAYANFSETGLYYIGGLLKHARALAAFTNPSTNSFKRLVPGFEAPVTICYGQANRSSTVRIPKYISDPKETRLEYRPPDATMNPYLGLAAMLMAGIDGIVNAIDPRAENFGPFDTNVFRNGEPGLTFLPRNLEEALEALQEDNEFLKREGVFSETLIQQWIKVKEREIQAIATMPHPFEYKMYFHL